MEGAGHRERDGSSFMFAAGLATARVDLHLGGEGGAVPGQYVMIRSMIEQPKGIREFREGTKSPSRNPTTAGLDEAIRRRLPPHDAFRHAAVKASSVIALSVRPGSAEPVLVVSEDDLDAKATPLFD